MEQKACRKSPWASGPSHRKAPRAENRLLGGWDAALQTEPLSSWGPGDSDLALPACQLLAGLCESPCSLGQCSVGRYPSREANWHCWHLCWGNELCDREPRLWGDSRLPDRQVRALWAVPWGERAGVAKVTEAKTRRALVRGQLDFPAAQRKSVREQWLCGTSRCCVWPATSSWNVLLLSSMNVTQWAYLGIDGSPEGTVTVVKIGSLANSQRSMRVQWAGEISSPEAFLKGGRSGLTGSWGYSGRD